MGEAAAEGHIGSQWHLTAKGTWVPHRLPHSILPLTQQASGSGVAVGTRPAMRPEVSSLPSQRRQAGRVAPPPVAVSPTLVPHAVKGMLCMKRPCTLTTSPGTARLTPCSPGIHERTGVPQIRGQAQKVPRGAQQGTVGGFGVHSQEERAQDGGL